MMSCGITFADTLITVVLHEMITLALQHLHYDYFHIIGKQLKTARQTRARRTETPSKRSP